MIVSQERGHEQVRVVFAAGVDDVRAAVHRVVVPGLDQRPRVAVHVAALDDEPQRLARPEQRAGRQDLDLQRDDLARGERKLPPVREHRLPRPRALLVELSVGRAQPAERHRAILEHRVEREPGQVPVGVQLLHRHEHVQVRRLWRGHPDLELHPADQLGGRLEAEVERGPAAATPGPFAVVGDRGGRAGPGPGQRARGRVQVQRLKRRAGHRPVVRGLPRPFVPGAP